jgi:O-antigen/teichoic acid export membrane protein
MIAKTMENPPATSAKSHHSTFFRQSGWLMIATVIGGFMSLGVHFLSKELSSSEYGAFITLLMVISAVPTIPLQMVFTHQAAQAVATNRERQLAGMLRMAWLWMTVLWVFGAGIALGFQGRIVESWGLSSPVALWVTLLAVLASLWFPIFNGAMQGRQNFFWMGWGSILNGAVRVAIAYALVRMFHKGETGMVAGALAGVGMTVAIGVYQLRDWLKLKKEAFDRRALLSEAVPLLLGFGATQFLFTADTIFAKPYFSKEEMACYGLAGTLSRALLWLVLPLAGVMFPKIVHSNVKAEKTNLLGIVLIGTAVLAICGAIGLCIVGPFAIKIVSKPDYVPLTASLLPWYGGAMVPLALANVLVNDLLARGRFRIVPVLVGLAATYGFTLPYVLNHFPKSLQLVLQTLAVFNFLLLLVCAWAAFEKSARPAAANNNPK